jgi:hypothetical protein
MRDNDKGLKPANKEVKPMRPSQGWVMVGAEKTTIEAQYFPSLHKLILKEKAPWVKWNRPRRIQLATRI